MHITFVKKDSSSKFKRILFAHITITWNEYEKLNSV